MIRAQTVQPKWIKVVNYPPRSESRDITQRYREGYEYFNKLIQHNESIDVVALVENDDAYLPDYLEIMIKEWVKAGKPQIFGTNYTIYYHIQLRKYYTMTHFTRASAMNTLIKPNLKISWPRDDDPFTDLALWVKNRLNGVTFKPERHISIGIKHGVGLTGGMSHRDRFDRYNPPRGTDDADFKFLKATLDSESFNFYSTYFDEVSDSNGHLAKA
jgi:hypothetical protein